jgi:hypothetical protein
MLPLKKFFRLAWTKVEGKEKISIILSRAKLRLRCNQRNKKGFKAVSINILNTKIQHSKYFEC